MARALPVGTVLFVAALSASVTRAQAPVQQKLTPWQMQQVLVPIQQNRNQRHQANGAMRPRSPRVLFIGTRDVSGNYLPEMVAALARSADAAPLVFAAELADGASLVQQLSQGSAVARIREGKWDVVVLQDESRMPLRMPEATLEASLALNQEIARAGARTLYYQTWAPNGKPDNLARISNTYKTCQSRSIVSSVAPVGRAFQLALAANPTLVLSNPEKGEPTEAGTYLAASVFYANIYGRSPAGLPGRLEEQSKVIANLPPATARLLQQAALAAYMGH